MLMRRSCAGWPARHQVDLIALVGRRRRPDRCSADERIDRNDRHRSCSPGAQTGLSGSPGSWRLADVRVGRDLIGLAAQQAAAVIGEGHRCAATSSSGLASSSRNSSCHWSWRLRDVPTRFDPYVEVRFVGGELAKATHLRSSDAVSNVRSARGHRFRMSVEPRAGGELSPP